MTDLQHEAQQAWRWLRDNTFRTKRDRMQREGSAYLLHHEGVAEFSLYHHQGIIDFALSQGYVKGTGTKRSKGERR